MSAPLSDRRCDAAHYRRQPLSPQYQHQHQLQRFLHISQSPGQQYYDANFHPDQQCWQPTVELQYQCQADAYAEARAHIHSNFHQDSLDFSQPQTPAPLALIENSPSTWLHQSSTLTPHSATGTYHHNRNSSLNSSNSIGPVSSFSSSTTTPEHINDLPYYDYPEQQRLLQRYFDLPDSDCEDLSVPYVMDEEKYEHDDNLILPDISDHHDETLLCQEVPQFPARLPTMESSESALDETSAVDKMRPTGSLIVEAGTYSCTYSGCSLRFDSPTRLQRHKRQRHRNAAALTMGGLEVGMNSGAQRNSQAGPHKCERVNPSTGKPCNTVFSRPYDLTRHEDTIHNARKPKVYCHVCTEEKSFSRNDALTRHLRVVHPEQAQFAKRKRGTGHN